MSKKTLITIAVVLIIILLGLFGYYYLTKNKTGEDNPSIGNVFKNFFPFGGDEGNTPIATTTDNNTNNNNETPETSVDFTSKLRKITSEPVAGVGLIDVKAGTVLRYIEKATGHIYEVELFSPRQGRISNTTLPRVYKALWGNKNNSLVAQYLEDDDTTVDSFSLTVKETSTTTENVISGIEFPKNIRDVSVLDGNIFYLETDINGSYGYISNWQATSKKQIWTSPIKGLLSQYVNSTTLALTTKPNENSEGFLYFVNTGNGSYKKILGSIVGLSTLINDNATEVLYLDQGSGVATNIYNIASKSIKGVSPATFPEKCAWSKVDRQVIYCAVPKSLLSNTSLTNWYLGYISTADNIWKYDLKNNTSEIILELSKEAGQDIDVVTPTLSTNEQYLVFVNKKDNSLWSLDLTK